MVERIVFVEISRLVEMIGRVRWVGLVEKAEN